MMRIESGESIGKQEIVQGINEDEQRPLTEEEEIFSRFLTEAEKKYSDYMQELKNKKEKHEESNTA